MKFNQYFVLSLLRCILVIVASTQFATGSLADSRPNILVILADDLGFSDLGCYGSEIATPNLDRLANEGAKFTSFYTSARCCPSRASLMTGLHPHQTGIGSFATAKPQADWGPAYTGHLLPTCATLAEMLGDAGYSTWMVGKWHMGIPGPIERGFQNYFGYKNFLSHSESQWDPSLYVRLPEGTPPELTYAQDSFYVTDVFTDYALTFLKQARAKPDQPFFLYLAHSSPHFPIQAPKQSIDKNLATYRQGWDVLRTARLQKQKSLGLVSADVVLPPLSKVPVDRDDIANGFSGRPNPPWDQIESSRQEDLARRMATFAAMVQHVDVGVGRILADLEFHQELENTMIVFLSDNGACYEWGPYGFDGRSRDGVTLLHAGDKLDQMGQAGTHSSYGSGWANLGNTPLNMYKHFCHEGGIASPLIVHWPKLKKSAEPWIRAPVHLMDIVPTVLAASGVDYPQQRQGQAIQPLEGLSLLETIQGQPLEERPLAFEHQGARGLRRGDWKVVWSKRESQPLQWELYHLPSDRSEQRNLAAEKPELTAELVGLWNQWAERVGAEPFQKQKDDNQTALERKNSATAGNAKGRKSIAKSESPRIANEPLTIDVEVEFPAQSTGVVVAQGGREYGFAVHFVGGVPAFDVRIAGKLAQVRGDKPVSGKIRVRATLDSNELRLLINDQQPFIARSAGLIPVQPQDGLSIGFDDLTAAGDYESPNRFSGDVISVKVVTTTSVVIPLPSK